MTTTLKQYIAERREIAEKAAPLADYEELIEFLEKHTQYYKRKLVRDLLRKSEDIETLLKIIEVQDGALEAAQFSLEGSGGGVTATSAQIRADRAQVEAMLAQSEKGRNETPEA